MSRSTQAPWINARSSLRKDTLINSSNFLTNLHQWIVLTKPRDSKLSFNQSNRGFSQSGIDYNNLSVQLGKQSTSSPFFSSSRSYFILLFHSDIISDCQFHILCEINILKLKSDCSFYETLCNVRRVISIVTPRLWRRDSSRAGVSRRR